MLRFILIILITLFFGIPYLYEQAIATETKIIELNGKEWLVTIEPGKEPMFKPLEKPRAKVKKLPFVIHGKEEAEVATVPIVKEEPEWQRRTVKESKIVQTCNDSITGCVMTPEGDCPDCKTELVKEETIEVVQKSEFTEFKEKLELGKKIEKMHEDLPDFLVAYQYLRDSGSPDWICWKVQETCWAGAPISIEDLFIGKQNASYCNSIGHVFFDYTRPLESCHKSKILNL